MADATPRKASAAKKAPGETPTARRRRPVREEEAQAMPDNSNGRNPLLIPLALVALIAVAFGGILLGLALADDDNGTAAADGTPTTVVTSPPETGDGDCHKQCTDDTQPPATQPKVDCNGSSDLKCFVPRELAEGEQVVAIAGTCIEGDVTIQLNSGWRPVFDDLRDSGHLTCFESDTAVVSTYPSHISAATREEHQQNMLTLAGQCFEGSNGCPSVHVLVVRNGEIVADYWVNK